MSGLWLSLAVASAHSPSFGMTALSARDEAPDELWGLTDGWGVVHSDDGGATWAWSCEESIGTDGVYDVLAWSDGVALIATTDGLRQVDTACGAAPVPGLPEGFVLRLERLGGRAAAAAVGPEEGGVAWCDELGCVASELWAPRLYPKAFARDGDTLWVSVVYTDTLVGELWRTDDGASFRMVHRWPDGDVDPRVLHADGELVLVWARPREEQATPALLRSTDGGATFTSTFAAGHYTDPAPGLAVFGGELLLGSWFGARTWRSGDGGATFSEVSDTAPAVRCGLARADELLVCADHLADGFDVARTADLRRFTPLSCLEQAGPADCAAAACAEYVDAWVTAGSYGGGQCDQGGDSADEPPPACACDQGGAAGALGVLALAWRQWRLQRPRKR